LFAADDQRIWLCDDGVAVEVPKAQLVTAIATYTAPLDVMHPELWVGMARHPEGLPPEGASCEASHDEAPVAQLVAVSRAGHTVQGPLLDVSPTTVVMEVEHVPLCLAVAELRALKIALTRYGPERAITPAVSAWGGDLVPPAVVGSVVATNGAQGSYTYRTSLADIDLRRVATLKPFARYPKAAPAWLRCPTAPAPEEAAPPFAL
jgi:hypothetical protein